MGGGTGRRQALLGIKVSHLTFLLAPQSGWPTPWGWPSEPARVAGRGHPLLISSLEFLGFFHRWKAPLPRCPLVALNLVRAPSLIGQGAAAMTWTRLMPTGWNSSTQSSRRWVGDLPGENGTGPGHTGSSSKPLRMAVATAGLWHSTGLGESPCYVTDYCASISVVFRWRQ